MATLTWLLDVNAPNAAKTFNEIGLRVDELDRSLRKTREITLGDKDAMAKLAGLRIQADRFKDRIHNMPLTIEGAAKAEAQLLGLEVTADRLKEKLGDVGKAGILGRLGGLFPGGGSGAGGILRGAGAAGGGLLGLLGSGGATPYLYGAAALGAALLAPSALPLALGGLTGFGAGGVALMLGAKGAPLLKADQQALARARAAIAASPKTPPTASQLLALRQAQAKFAQDQARYGEFAPLNQTFSGLGNTALGVFASALEAKGPAFAGRAGLGGQGGLSSGPSFLQGLTSLLRQIGGFIKSIGPELGDMFRASLPFLKSFVGFLEQAAKVLLPVFVQMLQEMRPFLPLISKGLMNIVDGLAGFLKAIGPSGMEASAKIFVVLTKGMAAVMVALGHTINWLVEHVPDWAHNVAAWWDRLRHWTAAAFDATRNVILGFFHTVTHDFDQWRHGWAHIWDVVYSGTIGAVIRIDKGILSWLGKIPGQVAGIFRGAGKWLYNAGKDVIQGLWNGLLFIWHKVTGFISGIAKWIKDHKGPVHLDATLLEPAGRALMSGLLRGLMGGFGSVADFIGGITGKIAGALGLGGANPSALQKAALSMFPAFGWSAGQLPYLIALWNQESGWRWNATNPTSGAYGIPQALPASKMAAAGPDWRTNPITQIRWGLAYIRSVYGTPAAAEAHENAVHWYGSGLAGAIFNRPTLIGVGERGAERVDVTPVGRAGSGKALVHVGQMVVQDATDMALVAQRLSFAIYAAGLGS